MTGSERKSSPPLSSSAFALHPRNAAPPARYNKNLTRPPSEVLGCMAMEPVNRAKIRSPAGKQPKTRGAGSLHLGQVEFQCLGDVPDDVVGRVGCRVEAGHGAHLAEGQVLDAVERIADLLL